MTTASRTRAAHGAVAVAAVVGVLALGVACYGPTEMRVEVATDLPCRAPNRPTIRTTIAVGASASEALVAADTTTCAPGAKSDNDVGSLVIVPSGARDAHATVEVTTTTDGGPTEDCKPAPVGGAPGDCSKVPGNCTLPANCIVARRTFAFISHSSRALPIKLYARCAGKACGDEQTCGRTGECESALVQSCGSIASDCVPNPVDASAPPDASVDAGLDVAPDGAISPRSCTIPAGNTLVTNTNNAFSELLAGNSTRLFWSTVQSSGSTASYQLKSVAKSGGVAEAVDLPSSPQPYTALAADDEALWVATAEYVTRVALGKLSNQKPLQFTSVKGTKAIAIGPRPPGGEPKVYLVTMGAGPSTLLVAQTPGWTPTPTQAAGGIAVAASASHIYVLDGVGRLNRSADALAQSPPEQFPAVGSIDVAQLDGTAFFSASSSSSGGSGAPGIYSIDDAIAPDAGSPAILAAENGVGRIAVHASSVYYLRRRLQGEPSDARNAGVFRRPKVSDGVKTPGVVATGFFDVHGLVVDDDCAYAYFFAAPNAATAYAPLNLRVFPLGP